MTTVRSLAYTYPSVTSGLFEVRHDMPAEFFGFARNADSIARLGGQVPKIRAYEVVAAA